MKFFKNIKQYFSYSKYAAKSELKNEVANSYLNWFWWILDPLAFMLIYSFIVTIVFKSGEENITAFVFIGLTIWTFFNLMITGSVKIINQNKGIVTKVYIPKYILLLSRSFVYLFKTGISFILIFIMMIILKIPFTIGFLNLIPVIFVLYIVCFGFGTIIMHFGVFVEDLYNITNIVLKLMFYLSGIFYSIPKRIPSSFSKYLLNINPAAFFIHQFRKILLYNEMPNYLILGIWFLVGLASLGIGVAIIHKYENSYAKVI